MAFKRTYKKRTFKNSNATKKDVKKMIKSLVPKPELKVWPTTAAGSVGFGIGIMTHLSAVSQGTSSEERIGDKIKLKYLNIRFNTRAGNLVVPAVSVIQRVIIFKDKQSNAAAPAALDLLETLTINSYYNLDFKDRFHVYKDVKMAVNPYSPVKLRSINIKANVGLIYPAAAAAGLIPQTNSIFMLIFHDAPDLANQPTYDYEARLRYTDE